MINLSEFKLTYRLNTQWKQILLATVLGVVFYQLTNLLRPEYGNLKHVAAGNYWLYFKDLVVFYFCFEWISIIIFMNLSRLYTRLLRLNTLKPGWGSLFFYNLKYLPFICLSILIFAPVTNSIRYLVLYAPNWSMAAYYPEFFMHKVMYIRYLVPLFFLGLGYLNYNVFLDFNDWQKLRFKEKLKAKEEPQAAKPIKVHDGNGDTFVDIEDIIFIELKNKNYEVNTNTQVFQSKTTIAEFEEILHPAQFFRVNRSVIINLKHFKNYSFWEYDKYILRLKDNKTEFVMQRARLKVLKSILKV